VVKIDSTKYGDTKRNKPGQCRIIAGKWRGRIIRFDDADGLRPTTDRIRETVFNWLQGYLSQSRCLDCFAGSGVLGFEALSRGARDVVFIENNLNTLNNLKANASALAIDIKALTIRHEDALEWLKMVCAQNAQFDLVFLDPPFHTDQLRKGCALLNNSGCLAEDAIIYVEHEVDTRLDVPDNWASLKEKTSGRVTYKLFIHKSINNGN